MDSTLGNYYQFNKEDAYKFARFINARDKERNGQLVFKVCPYCKAIGKDNEDKFSISLDTGQFHCKRAKCGAHGNMITLAKDFGYDLGRDISEYYGLRVVKYRRPKKVPEFSPNEQVFDFFKDRGISREIVQKYHVEYSKDESHKDTIAIPFITEKQEIECVKYRKMHFDKTKDKNKEWFVENCKPILFGMGQCKDFGTLVITEGQMDAMALAESGVDNPVSVPNGANGFTWIPHCWDWVNKFDRIIVFGDCENEKITLVDEIAKRFAQKLVFKIREIDYKGCKDANEILLAYGKEAILEAIENAQEVSQEEIKDMSLVGTFNIEDAEKVSSGFEELDKAMGGGLVFGSLTVLTGKRGEGKSTFASMIVSNLINQGVKTFLYSGELMNEMAKGWLVQQMSGENKATGEQLELINNVLRGNAYMYDVDHVSDETLDIPKLIEKAMNKYQCRAFIIDNLMSAMTVDSNIYEHQANMVGKLAEMARVYKLVIILVAHPKKGNSGDINDDISGSSNITDRAHYVIRYSRAENEPDFVRVLEMSKNRFTGRLILKKDNVRVYYNSHNRRITDTADAELQYRWFFNLDKKEEVEEDIPF